MIHQLMVLNAIVTMLRSALHKPVGLAEIPAEVADEPYAIVYPIGGDFDGPPLTGSWDDAHFPVQVTAVGLRCDQALWLADRVREVVLGGTPLLLSHVAEMGRSLELGPELVEGDSVDTVVQRFVFHLTPA